MCVPTPNTKVTVNMKKYTSEYKLGYYTEGQDGRLYVLPHTTDSSKNIILTKELIENNYINQSGHLNVKGMLTLYKSSFSERNLYRVIKNLGVKYKKQARGKVERSSYFIDADTDAKNTKQYIIQNTNVDGDDIILTKEIIETKYLTESGHLNTKELMQLEGVSFTEHNLYKVVKKLGVKYKKMSTSKNEHDILDFIKDLNLGFNVHQQNRTLISPKEIDIYIPEMNLAIEYNGLVFHSAGKSKSKMLNTPHFDKNYHKSKTDECKAKGVKLIHINENEWSDPNKQEIFKSIIRQNLCVPFNETYVYTYIINDESDIVLIKDTQVVFDFLKTNSLFYEDIINPDPDLINTKVLGIYSGATREELIECYVFNANTNGGGEVSVQCVKKINTKIKYTNKKSTLSGILRVASVDTIRIKFDMRIGVCEETIELFSALPNVMAIRDLPPVGRYFNPSLSMGSVELIDTAKSELTDPGLIKLGFRIIYDAGVLEYTFSYP